MSVGGRRAVDYAGQRMELELKRLGRSALWCGYGSWQECWRLFAGLGPFGPPEILADAADSNQPNKRVSGSRHAFTG